MIPDMKLPAFHPFFVRLFLFCLAIIVVSGILGPWIISTRLLYGFGFYIYANMGKMILFSAVAFIILIRQNLKDITVYPWQKNQYGAIAVALMLMGVFYVVGRQLLMEQQPASNLPLFIGAHLLFIAIPVLLAMGIFGIRFLKAFVATFRRELLMCLAMSIVFYFAIFQVWKLWPFFSGVVLRSVTLLLSLHVSPVREIGPLTLLVDDFAVRIEQACSGLDSIFLFTSLYTLIALVEWKHIHKKRVIFLYIPAVLGMFLVNILRVYVLILVGVYISPQLALQLFHTYLGMVLFIIYFYFFLSVSAKYLRKVS